MVKYARAQQRKYHNSLLRKAQVIKICPPLRGTHSLYIDCDAITEVDETIVVTVDEVGLPEGIILNETATHLLSTSTRVTTNSLFDTGAIEFPVIAGDATNTEYRTPAKTSKRSRG